MGKILSYPANSNPSSTFSFIGADPDAPTVTQIVSTGTLGPWVNVRRYGATGDGTTDDTTAIQDAVNAVISAGGGVVYFPAGSYKITSTITCEVPDAGTVIFLGDGQRATFIYSYVTGDAIRFYDTTVFDNTPMGYGSGLRDLGIDGTNAGAASNGLHTGDLANLTIRDVLIQNFTGTGSTGLLLDNSVNWTEEADVRATLLNCSTHAEFTVTTGTNSFGYGNFDLTIIQSSNQQNGVVLSSSAYLYNGKLKIRGNFTGGTSTTTAAVLTLTGSLNSNVTSMVNQELDIQIENANSTYNIASISLNATDGCYLVSCYGILDFTAGGSTFGSAVIGQATFQFTGIVSDDGTLAPAGAGYEAASGTWRAVNLATTYPLPTVAPTGLAFPTAAADFFQATLTADSTVALTTATVNDASTLGVPQRVTIFITQAASGGPYTVTWPKPASPSASDPAVYWAGGTAPTMSTGASEVDMYQLSTYDGIHWYGTATQNLK